MSVFALSLVMVAALLHALWNVAAKKAGGGKRFVRRGGRPRGEGDRGVCIGGAVCMALGVAGLAPG